MTLMSYDDVTAYLAKKKRTPHLLLGNGFSMAYDPEIFSYNALHAFVENTQNPLLNKLFAIVNTKNFETVIQQLSVLCELIENFSSDKKLLADVRAAIEHLKTSLIEAINELHPEHVFKLSDEETASCAEYLSFFLDSGGSIFSTNYDVLLYWVLMRSELSNGDGFGRERLDDPTDRSTDEEWSDDLLWGINKSSQTIHYLHGALPLFDTGTEIVKEQYDHLEGNYIMENIQKRLQGNEYPVFVAAGDGKEKLNHIKHNEYLNYCYDQLCTVSGSVVTFGFNFGESDGHIIEALNKASRRSYEDKLWSIYIGVYSEDDISRIAKISGEFNAKVTMFDAKTASIWR